MRFPMHRIIASMFMTVDGVVEARQNGTSRTYRTAFKALAAGEAFR